MTKIRRDFYLKQIAPFIDTDIVKVLTGLRRSGKSVLLEFIREDLRQRGVPETNIFFYNFEDLSLCPLCSAKSLHAEIKKRASLCEGKVYLFFDEIQNVTQWELCVNSLRVTLNCDIFVTGSNSALLSQELSTHLSGRTVEFEVRPFSFAEFVALKRKLSVSDSIETLFREYLLWGGMPYLAQLDGDEEAKKHYLQDVFNSVLLKDIIVRHSVRDADLLEKLLSFVISQVGGAFSATSIKKFLKNESRLASTETILNYLKFAKEASLIEKAPMLDVRGKEFLKTNEKIYLTDHGFRQALFGSNERDIERVLENIVYMELLHRGFKVYVGRNHAKEIDFVAEKGKNRLYIQVSYLLSGEETIKREFVAYSKIDDNYPKYVLSMDAFDLSRNGIIHRNICDFLLDSQWGSSVKTTQL